MAKSKKEKNPGKNGVTGIGRASFPNLFEPFVNEEDGSKKFMITLIFDPEVPEEKKAMEALKADIDEIGKEAYGESWGVSDKLKNPLKFGNPKDPDTRPEYKGKYSVNFSMRAGKGKPGVIDVYKRAIDPEDQEGMYAGCYCRVSYYCTAFERSSNRGVTMVLSNVLKVRDGERIGGAREKAEDAFDGFFSDAPAGTDDSKALF